MNFVVSLNVSLFARTRNFAAAAKFVSEKQKHVSLFRKKVGKLVGVCPKGNQVLKFKGSYT